MSSYETGLTQFVFFKKQNHKNEFPDLNDSFQAYYNRLKPEDNESYSQNTQELGVMIHPPYFIGRICISHIEGFINTAFYKKDLSKLPLIHWLHVQAAPEQRGPGGTSEMLVAALFKYITEHDLPEWRDNISPSMEVLTTPNPSDFAKNYHKLFAKNQLITAQTFITQPV